MILGLNASTFNRQKYELPVNAWMKQALGISVTMAYTSRVEMKTFIFVFSRKFIFTFREKSLQKVTKITEIFTKIFAKTFAKTKMYEKTDTGNGKYCEIS
jgi:hypothetical protein